MKTWKYQPKKITRTRVKKDEEGNTIHDENDEPIDEEVEIDNPFSGFIEIQVPTYVERSEYAKVYSINKKDPKHGEKVLDGMGKMFKICEKHTKIVDLKLGEKKIDSLVELGYYSDGATIIQDLGNILVQGIPIEGN